MQQLHRYAMSQSQPFAPLVQLKEKCSNHTCQSYWQPSASIHMLTPAKGVRTMASLLLKALTVRQHLTSAQKISKHFACYLLAIYTRRIL